jgi:homoserine kinase
MALSLYDEFSAEESDRDGVETVWPSGQPYTAVPLSKNLLVKSLLSALEGFGHTPSGLRVTVRSVEIPIARGLGSSAACVIAGILLAGRIANVDVDAGVILDLAAKMEGHPDNTTPALVGGMTVAVRDGGIVYSKVSIPKSLGLVAMIPSFRLNTSKARKALPADYTREDCVFNIGRAALLVSALSGGDLTPLRTAVADRIHQPYREALIPGASQVMELAARAGALAEFVSGSGPTIMALVSGDPAAFAKEVGQRLPAKWRAVGLRPDLEGARIL